MTDLLDKVKRKACKDAGKTDLGSFGTGSTEVSTYRNSWRQNY